MEMNSIICNRNQSELRTTSFAWILK